MRLLKATKNYLKAQYFGTVSTSMGYHHIMEKSIAFTMATFLPGSTPSLRILFQEIRDFKSSQKETFTSAGSHHIHGPLAVGGNLVINTAATSEVNMDNVGSYVFPGDGSTTTGLLVAGSVT